MAKVNIWSVDKPAGGLHIKQKGSMNGKHTIGAKDAGGPAKRGSRIVLGSGNQGTSSLMGVTK